MKSKKLPKVSNIVAFLQAKGWELVGKNDLYYIFNPPADIGFLTKFQYFVPNNERFSDYEKVSEMIVSGLSDLYELDYQSFYSALCQKDAQMEQFLLNSNELLAQHA